MRFSRTSVTRNIPSVLRFSTEGKALHNSFLRSVKPDTANQSQQAKQPTPEESIKTSPTQNYETNTNTNTRKEVPRTFTAPLYGAQKTQHNTQMKNTHGELLRFAPRMKVIGVGGGGCNSVNNMIKKGLQGVDFIAANTDAQHLSTNLAENKIQLGRIFTQGLGCGANPNYGRAAAEESRQEIMDALKDAHMVFITCGMGGGTGTGAAPVVAEICAEMDILTVAVVTKPFAYEGRHRNNLALEGISTLFDRVDTLIVVPNENLFKLCDKNTTHDEAMGLANDVLLAGVKSITDLMTLPGSINLDFADVRAVMKGMGYGMMGTGQAEGADRALRAATDAINNPLIGSEVSIQTAKGVLVSVMGAPNEILLSEVVEASNLIKAEILDENVNLISGTAHDDNLKGQIRISIVATGLEPPAKTPVNAPSKVNGKGPK